MIAKTEPFTFGIPLIAGTSAQNWPLTEALLDLTVVSLQAQTDRDFRIVIAGHDKPRLPARQADVVFLEADWPAQAVRPDNLDSGRKKHAINQHVLRNGGGLLMFVDADDWVHVRLVEASRTLLGPDHVGGVIECGFATDLRSWRTLPIPHPAVFNHGFHRICGSSTVVRLRPDHPDPFRRNPHTVLHEHYRWKEIARERAATWACLPVCGNYVINTSVNHSEIHGPFASWRRLFNESVRREGEKLDEAFLGQFGLSMEQTRSHLASFFPFAA